MNRRMKNISAFLCVAVMAICGLVYISYSNQVYYDVCTTYSVSKITGYAVRVLEEMPEGYQFSAYDEDNAIRDGKVLEITYELVNPVNETMYLYDNMCYYMGENGTGVSVLHKNEDYLSLIGRVNEKVLPPGERTICKEYVWVPEGTGSISVREAHWSGSKEFEITF